jgi:hypothetical protein
VTLVYRLAAASKGWRRGVRKSATGYRSRNSVRSVDRPRVLRVKARIAADLDALAGRAVSTGDHEGADDPLGARIRHRRRLAGPEPELSQISQPEQRALLRVTWVAAL